MKNIRALVEEILAEKVDLLNKHCFKCEDGFYREVKGKELLVCDVCGQKVKRYPSPEELAEYKD